MTRRIGVLGVACAIALLVPGTAIADPGDLDDTFSGNGKQTADFAGRFDNAYGMALQPDGRAVLGGNTTPPSGASDFALARFTTGGELDPTFSGDGRRTLDFLGMDRRDEVDDLAVQADGKIVTAGWTGNHDLTNAGFAVARFRPNGTLDPTFSDDGMVRTNFPQGEAYGYSVGIDSEGRILVAGEVSVHDEATPSDWDFAVVRYRPNGTLDPSFGGDGKVLVDFDGGTDGAWDLAIQPNDKIVIAGWTRPGMFYRSAVARLRTDGQPDGSFNGDGRFTLNFRTQTHNWALAVRLRPDGKIVVGGHVDFDPAGGEIGLFRLTSSGTLDRAFGEDGKVIDSLAGGGGDYFDDLALQQDGKIVVTGRFEDADGQWLFVGRYWPGGGRDHGFGVNGFVQVKFGGEADAEGEAVEIQGNGKIVAAGTDASGPDSDFAVARLLP